MGTLDAGNPKLEESVEGGLETGSFFFFFLTREALQVKKPLITVYEENVEYGGKRRQVLRRLYAPTNA